MLVDRYGRAACYKGQGFGPIPCHPGTKKASVPWRKYRRGYRLSTQEMHRAWPRGSQHNIALLLGPVYHLLVLNVNQKHGHNGQRTLNGYPLPSTPTILTPHDGFAYLFRVPDHARYPFPFRVHAKVRGYPGIELRGAGGYQLVPSSHVAATDRDPAGDYRLADGWKLERLMADLADLPAWVIELWWAMDADGPASSGQARKATAQADLPAELTTSTSTSPSPRSRRRAPPPSKQELLTTRASSGARAYYCAKC